MQICDNSSEVLLIKREMIFLKIILSATKVEKIQVKMDENNFSYFVDKYFMIDF